MGWVHNANAAVARSAVGKYFRLEGSGHVCHYRNDVAQTTKFFDSLEKGRVPTSSPKFALA